MPSSSLFSRRFRQVVHIPVWGMWFLLEIVPVPGHTLFPRVCLIWYCTCPTYGKMIFRPARVTSPKLMCPLYTCTGDALLYRVPYKQPGTKCKMRRTPSRNYKFYRQHIPFHHPLLITFTLCHFDQAHHYHGRSCSRNGHRRCFHGWRQHSRHVSR